MVIVLPVCHKDKEAALRNLAWCKELDPKGVSFPCLVSFEVGFDASDVVSAAHTYFTAVQVNQYRPLSRAPLPWPQPQNWAWKQAVMRMKKGYRDPWLWWEQDAVPLKPGWLSSLAKAYSESGMPFLGAIGDDGNGQVQRHVNGVAIYPPDVLSYGPSAMYSCNTVAFDVLGGWRVLQQSAITPLIQHVWSWEMNGSRPPCTFRSKDDLERLDHNAVLFHRCRDSSLISMIKGSPEARLPTIPQSKPEEQEEIPKDTNEPDIWVLFGRNGDYINALPIFKLASERVGHPVKVAMMREFRNLYSGCSYVEPVPMDCKMGQYQLVKRDIITHYQHPRFIQPWADGRTISKRTLSFSVEPWLLAGIPEKYDDRSLRPLFDLRNKEREEKLISEHVKSQKPLMLLAVQGGFTSPFVNFRKFQKPIMERWGEKFEILDLCTIQAAFIYDLLAFMERAAVLITADSCHLHLAAATEIPTICLLSDRGDWMMSVPRCNVLWKGNYPNALARMPEIHRVISSLIPGGSHYEEANTRLHLPVTLVGVDNFKPQRTLEAMWDAMSKVTFRDAVLACLPGTQPEGGDWKGVRPFYVDMGTDRLSRERFMIFGLDDLFVAGHILHMEWDARVSNTFAWQDEWLRYDFIGAPWPWPFCQTGFTPCRRDNCVGNTGFAVYSKKFCSLVKQLAKPNDAQVRYSDAYICRNLRPALEQQGIQFAPERSASYFSCEDRVYAGQFGWHGQGTAKKNGFSLDTSVQETRAIVERPTPDNEVFGRPPFNGGVRVIHVVERHGGDEARIHRAFASWKQLYDSNMMEGVHSWRFQRSSMDIGDSRCLPYLKDILQSGMERSTADDIILFTNGDNLLHFDLGKVVRETLSQVPCICSYRLNVVKIPDLKAPLELVRTAGQPDFGRDLFAFRKSWLESHWDSIPDFFVGEWEWDLVMALMIRKENGVPITTKQGLHLPDPRSELPLGCVLHEMHTRPWLSTQYHTSPSKRHNLDLANEWYAGQNLLSFQIHP